MTCDTCKWWKDGGSKCESYGPEKILINLYGVCEHPKVNGETDAQNNLPNGKHRFFRHKVATMSVPEPWVKNNMLERENSHTVPLDEACPSATDDHCLCFLTGPKFGCIHFQSK